MDQYQHLAMAVINMAITDLTDKRRTPDERAHVRRFFSSDDLRFWCTIADLKAEAVREAAERHEQMLAGELPTLPQ